MAKDWLYTAIGVVGFGVLIWLVFAIMGNFWPSAVTPYSTGMSKEGGYLLNLPGLR